MSLWRLAGLRGSAALTAQGAAETCQPERVRGASSLLRWVRVMFHTRFCVELLGLRLGIAPQDVALPNRKAPRGCFDREELRHVQAYTFPALPHSHQLLDILVTT